MTERNPDGTPKIPTAPKIRNGSQFVFFYRDQRLNAPDAFTVQTVNVFEEEGDEVSVNPETGAMTFSIKHPLPVALVMNRTWDYMTSRPLKVPADIATAPWLFDGSLESGTGGNTSAPAKGAEVIDVVPEKVE